MSSPTTVNGNPGSHGQQRKTLAVQLDRLDTIIDAIDKVLPEVVADTVKEVVGAVVQQTVEAVVRELLGRPELMRALAPQPAMNPTPAQTCQSSRKPWLLRRAWSWLSAKVADAGAWVRSKIDRVVSGVCCLGETIGSKLKPVGMLIVLLIGGLAGWLRQHPGTVALAGSVGLLVGTVGYLAGPLISSAALGLAGSLASLAGAMLAPVLRFLRELRPLDDEI